MPATKQKKSSRIACKNFMYYLVMSTNMYLVLWANSNGSVSKVITLLSNLQSAVTILFYLKI